jgi:IS5 family transposase
VNQSLTEKGVMLKEGTILDASIINAPSSTKNKKGERDP